LAEGEAAHPANYRGCKHAKEELLKKRKPQGPPKPAGRVFSSKPVQANVTFAAALRGHTAGQKQQEAAVVPSKPQPQAAKTRQTATGQSVPALHVNSEAADMVKIITIVQQIMTELKGAVSEEGKILAITKIVFNLMNRNDQ
jgi:hypothetical protein